MKRLSLVLSLAGLVALVALAPAAPMGGMSGGHHTFTAHLTGQAEVPPVDTQAHGNAMFWADGDSVRYRLVANGIEHVTGAHIHLGLSGTNGPVVVSLFNPASPTDTVNGTLTSGSFAASDLTGPLAGMTLDDLLAKMASDSTYVNVHTTENPSGEIRGMITEGKANMEKGMEHSGGGH